MKYNKFYMLNSIYVNYIYISNLFACFLKKQLSFFLEIVVSLLISINGLSKIHLSISKISLSNLNTSNFAGVYKFL